MCFSAEGAPEFLSRGEIDELVGDPSHLKGPQLKKFEWVNILLFLSSFSEPLIMFSQNFPRNNSTFWSCFCHIKLPQRKFCTENQSQPRTKFLESLHPTHPLKIHSPLGSTWFPGVPKFVSPACEYNITKNRVARFPAKIDFLKLKYNCWFCVCF